MKVDFNVFYYIYRDDIVLWYLGGILQVLFECGQYFRVVFVDCSDNYRWFLWICVG